MRRVLFLLLLLGLIAAAAVGAVAWERANYAAPGPEAAKGEATVVLIPPGEGVPAIANTLEKAGVVEERHIVPLGRAAARASATRSRPANTAIPSAASMQDIVAILMSGKSIQHKLTAAEGLTSADDLRSGEGRPRAHRRCRARCRPKARFCRRPISSPAARRAPSSSRACTRRKRSCLPRCGRARQGPADRHSARGPDPGLDRRKGNRAAGRAPPHRRRVREPADDAA